MNIRAIRPFLAALTVCLLAAGATTAEAQYRYGKARRGASGGGGDAAAGFFLLLEGGTANPRNVDHVVATESGGSIFAPIIPAWDDDVAGRIALGWAFASGDRISASYWTFDTDLDVVGTATLGGVLNFAIGPPIRSGASVFGATGSPGYYDLRTELTAETADLTWARRHELTERWSLEWSVSARYAHFEEIHRGTYDESGSPVGANRFAVEKRNDGKMFGGRAAVRGDYRIGAFSLGAGLGLSFLDGEVDARSSLTANGSSNGALGSSLGLGFDDGRSGRITDFEATAAWHATDRFRLSLGWEQQGWDDIVSDRVRNFPDTAVPLAERDTITFSAYKLGLYFIF